MSRLGERGGVGKGGGGGKGKRGGRRERVAAIDIGSNAIRLTVAKVRKSGPVQVDYVRAPVRLGQSAFVTGRLTEENLDAAVEAMADFRKRMNRHDVVRYRAVATSAVRDAENGAELVERTRREAGIDIEVIDGREEARLAWLAVRDRLEVEGRWLLVDLGGGSLEVSTVRGDELDRSESYPLGTVRLLERIGASGTAVEEALTELEEELALPERGELRGMLATGGNIEELAKLAGAKRARTGASRLSLESLSRTMERVESLTYEQRLKKLGLRPDRADVIVPAGRIYRRVAELAGVDELVVPNVGVSQGVLLELA